MTGAAPNGNGGGDHFPVREGRVQELSNSLILQVGIICPGNESVILGIRCVVGVRKWRLSAMTVTVTPETRREIGALLEGV